MTYHYDALNRRTAAIYSAAPAETALYGYDATAGGNAGVGRLTSAQNDGATVALRYDARGNVIADTRTVGGVTYTTHYDYDAAGMPTFAVDPKGENAFVLAGVGALAVGLAAVAVIGSVAGDAASHSGTGQSNSAGEGRGVVVPFPLGGRDRSKEKSCSDSPKDDACKLRQRALEDEKFMAFELVGRSPSARQVVAYNNWVIKFNGRVRVHNDNCPLNRVSHAQPLLR